MQRGARYTGRGADGGGRPQRHAACRRGRGCRFGAGHGEERTPNMMPMFVTLEVSKLSGWLNTLAPCREPKGGQAVRGEVRGGRDGGGRRRQAACSGVLDCRLGAGCGEERTLNIEFMVVTLDVSKLSGWLNALAPCGEPKGGHTMRRRGAAWEAGGGRQPLFTQRAGGGAAADLGQGTGRSARRRSASWL